MRLLSRDLSAAAAALARPMESPIRIYVSMDLHTAGPIHLQRLAPWLACRQKGCTAARRDTTSSGALLIGKMMLVWGGCQRQIAYGCGSAFDSNGMLMLLLCAASSGHRIGFGAAHSIILAAHFAKVRIQMNQLLL